MTHDLHNHIRSKGVGLCLNAAAAEFTPDSVILSNGARIPAEMIILSVGVRPETRFLEGSGIELGRAGRFWWTSGCAPMWPMSTPSATPSRCGILSPG